MLPDDYNTRKYFIWQYVLANCSMLLNVVDQSYHFPRLLSLTVDSDTFDKKNESIPVILMMIKNFSRFSFQ